MFLKESHVDRTDVLEGVSCSQVLSRGFAGISASTDAGACGLNRCQVRSGTHSHCRPCLKSIEVSLSSALRIRETVHRETLNPKFMRERDAMQALLKSGQSLSERCLDLLRLKGRFSRISAVVNGSRLGLGCAGCFAGWRKDKSQTRSSRQQEWLRQWAASNQSAAVQAKEAPKAATDADLRPRKTDMTAQR
eukprot:1294506-Pleurochrysis_carterae.AAC.2